MSPIPVQRAEFFMNGDVAAVPTEFVVVDQRERFAQIETTGRDPYDRYHGSLGAHCAGWSDGSYGIHNSPEAVFATEVLYVMPDRDRITEILREFAKIDEAEWARRMLVAIEMLEQP